MCSIPDLTLLSISIGNKLQSETHIGAGAAKQSRESEEGPSSNNASDNQYIVDLNDSGLTIVTFNDQDNKTENEEFFKALDNSTAMWLSEGMQNVLLDISNREWRPKNQMFTVGQNAWFDKMDDDSRKRFIHMFSTDLLSSEKKIQLFLYRLFNNGDQKFWIADCIAKSIVGAANIHLTKTEKQWLPEFLNDRISSFTRGVIKKYKQEVNILKEYKVE